MRLSPARRARALHRFLRWLRKGHPSRSPVRLVVHPRHSVVAVYYPEDDRTDLGFGLYLPDRREMHVGCGFGSLAANLETVAHEYWHHLHRHSQRLGGHYAAERFAGVQVRRYMRETYGDAEAKGWPEVRRVRQPER